MEHRSIFIAHRGESYDAPENTLAAINLAWERNADAVEVDIHLTKDNEIVVIHDANTNRVGNRNKLVKNQTLEEIKQLDVGSWKGIEFKSEKIPTLIEVIESLPPDKKLIVEIKCGREIINPLQKLLSNMNLPVYQLEFISFNLQVCSELKKTFPEYKVLLLSELDYTWLHRIFRPSVEALINSALINRLDGVDVWVGKIIDKNFVQKCRENNLILYNIKDLNFAFAV